MSIDYTRKFGGQWLDCGAAGFNVHHPRYGAYGDGTTDDSAALIAADRDGPAMGSPGKTYFIAKSIVLRNGWRPNGSKLRPGAGARVEIEGPLHAGMAHFVDAGSVGEVHFGVSSISAILPQWWGARGDGLMDDTAPLRRAIQAAEESFGAGVALCGSFRVTSTLSIQRTGVVIRGSGAGSRESRSPGHPSCVVWRGAPATAVFELGGSGPAFAIEMRDFAIDGADIAGVVGLHLNRSCSNCVFDGILVADCDTAWDLEENCFSNRWYNCVSYGFSRQGWRLRGMNHNSAFVACKAWGGQAKRPVYSLSVGENGHCSGVTMVSCDFEAWHVRAQVKAWQARALHIDGCYFEAKDADTDVLIDLGDGRAGDVSAFAIRTNYMIGNSAGAHAFRLASVDSGDVATNYLGGFTSYTIDNLGASEVRVMGNRLGDAEELANRTAGLVTGGQGE